MLIQRSDFDGRSTVRLIGELDSAGRAGIEARLFELVEDEDTRIDVADARFSDLGSVRMLVACRERAQLNGRVMEIVNAPPHVERMLEMLDRGHYWRPQRLERQGDGATYQPAVRTTTDAQRSRPGSEQIVRLECPTCNHQTFRPESAATACENCGSALEAIAVFRDRRRIDMPVEQDRRGD